MPDWLKNQLLRAFQKGDVRKVRLLNDCWYFYQTQCYVTKVEPTSKSSSTLH